MCVISIILIGCACGKGEMESGVRHAESNDRYGKWAIIRERNEGNTLTKTYKGVDRDIDRRWRVT